MLTLSKTQRASQNPFLGEIVPIRAKQTKREEGVYDQYTPTSAEFVAAEPGQLQPEGGLGTLSKALWWLLLFFIISRWLLFSLEADNYLLKFPYQDDSPAYLNTARVYLGQATWQQFGLTPYTRTPVYPLFLALFLLWPAYALPLIFLTQQLISFALVLTVFLFIRAHHRPMIAIFIASLLIFFFDFTLYGFLIRNEIIFAALILSATLCYLRLFQATSPVWPMTSGLLFGLSVLTRPVSFLIFIPLLLPILISVFSSRLSPSRGITAYTLFCLTFFLPVLPWLANNYLLTHNFVLQLETSLVHATFPGGHYQAYDVTQYIDPAGKTPLEIDQALFSLAIYRIKTQPKTWLLNSWHNFTWRLWSMGFTDTYLRYFGYLPPDGGYHRTSIPLWLRWLRSSNVFSSPAAINPVYHLYFVLNNFLGFSMVALSLLSLVLFPFFPSRSQTIFFIILYFWLISSLFQFSGSRLLLPVIPLLFMILPDFPRALTAFFHRRPQTSHD